MIRNQIIFHGDQMNAGQLKLTIELVPHSCWYSNVRSNVTTTTWRRLQNIVFKAANQTCEICGQTGSKHPLECHEIWSYDDHRCIQSLTRLIALCPRCHEVKHIGFAIQRGRLQHALKWFCEVNGTTPSDAVAYIQHQLKVTEIRGQFAWTLDLSLLKTKYAVQLKPDNRELHFK